MGSGCKKGKTKSVEDSTSNKEFPPKAFKMQAETRADICVLMTDEVLQISPEKLSFGW